MKRPEVLCDHVQRDISHLMKSQEVKRKNALIAIGGCLKFQQVCQNLCNNVSSVNFPEVFINSLINWWHVPSHLLGDQFSRFHGYERPDGSHGVPVAPQLRRHHHFRGPAVHQRDWIPASGWFLPLLITIRVAFSRARWCETFKKLQNVTGTACDATRQSSQ